MSYRGSIPAKGNYYLKADFCGDPGAPARAFWNEHGDWLAFYWVDGAPVGTTVNPKKPYTGPPACFASVPDIDFSYSPNDHLCRFVEGFEQFWATYSGRLPDYAGHGHEVFLEAVGSADPNYPGDVSGLPDVDLCSGTVLDVINGTCTDPNQPRSALVGNTGIRKAYTIPDPGATDISLRYHKDDEYADELFETYTVPLDAFELEYCGYFGGMTYEGMPAFENPMNCSPLLWNPVTGEACTQCPAPADRWASMRSCLAAQPNDRLVTCNGVLGNNPSCPTSDYSEPGTRSRIRIRIRVISPVAGPGASIAGILSPVTIVHISAGTLCRRGAPCASRCPADGLPTSAISQTCFLTTVT